MKTLFFLLFLSAPAFAGELTMYVLPSKGIDWTSPKKLLLSAAKSYFSSHAFGFAWIDLKCQETSLATAVDGDSPGFFTELFWRGAGLGIFYHSFTGKLVSQEKLQDLYNDALKDGDLRFVRFQINEGQCKRAATYIKEFETHHVEKNFGLAHRPRAAEGANPISYAVSVIDVLNLLKQEMKEAWVTGIKLPLEFAGHPLRENSVSVFQLYGRDAWASESEKSQTLHFWNPDKIWSWITQKVERKPNSEFSVVKIETARGIVFEMSHFPVPEEPIWQQNLP